VGESKFQVEQLVQARSFFKSSISIPIAYICDLYTYKRNQFLRRQHRMVCVLLEYSEGIEILKYSLGVPSDMFNFKLCIVFTEIYLDKLKKTFPIFCVK